MSNSRGFTLIELLAAMSISGLVMLGGILLLDQVSDSSARIASRGRVVTREGTGARLLRQLFLDARVTTDSADRFRGDEHSTEFSTLCQRPGGWMETCRVALGIDRRKDTSVVIVALSDGENLELLRQPGSAELRYFDVSDGDTLWLQRWATSIAIPVAIGFVSGPDTAIYPIGAQRE